MSFLHLDDYPPPTSNARQHEPYQDNPATTSLQRTNIRFSDLNDTEPRLPGFHSSVSFIPTPEGVSKCPTYVRRRSRMEDREPSLIFV